MDWPRFWWTMAMVGICVLAAGGLWLGWRNRARRQSGFPALPERPDQTGTELTPSIGGVYVSTVYAGQWQNRIVAAGLGRRAKAQLHVTPAGLLIDRIGEDEIWIPAADLREVGTSAGTAGKVMATPDAILLISWQWGDTLVSSGIRSDDLHAQVGWIAAANGLASARTPAATDVQDDVTE